MNPSIELAPVAADVAPTEVRETVTGAEAILKCLLAEGVNTIFGYPGGAIMPVYDALYHYGRRVDPRYEHRPDVWRKLASHFFTTFPQLEGLRFSHEWAGAIDSSTQFTAFFGTARGGRVAYAAGFMGATTVNSWECPSCRPG